jgi:hypothetical protein
MHTLFALQNLSYFDHSVGWIASSSSRQVRRLRLAGHGDERQEQQEDLFVLATSTWKRGMAGTWVAPTYRPVRRRRRLESPHQEGSQTSDNPAFRKEFQRIVEGARKAGLPKS